MSNLVSMDGAGEDVRETCSFYVTNVPLALFDKEADASVRDEFESMFRAYGEEVRFKYLKSFGRVLVLYSDAEQRHLAESSLNRLEFRGILLNLKPVDAIILGSRSLEPPEREHNFLISPPPSPPVNWEPTHEAPPVINTNLISALANLQSPGSSREVYSATRSTPGIVIVTPNNEREDYLTPVCARRDQELQPQIRISALPRHIVQTSCPPRP